MKGTYLRLRISLIAVNLLLTPLDSEAVGTEGTVLGSALTV